MKYLLLLTALMTLCSCKENAEIKEKIIYRDVADTNVAAINTTEPVVELTPLTKEFGALVVREGEFTGTSKIVPWSSWWYPTKSKTLFENENPNELAPLQKYDRYVLESKGHDPESALFEKMEIYNPSEVNWAGLCHAWSVASVLHNEPKIDIIKNGMTFNIADQKSLILKSYENAEGLKFYGSRNNGGYDDDFNDVYPDQFHRFSQVFLFEKHLPFLMDYDPSFPVWSVPVYNIKFKIVKEDEHSAHVKAWVTIASPLVDNINFTGTKKSVKYYEYKLFGKWVGVDLLVTSSKWVNDSIYDHPDFLVAYPQNIKRSSLNTKLEISQIDEILGSEIIPTTGI
jgi:hypothetical protein